MEEQLQQFFNQLPPELQKKIQMLPPEKQKEVLMDLIQRSNKQEFALGGNIPVEAERNENLTINNGQEPEVEGGYIEKKSHNPVTGQTTYEIPNNELNQTHEEGGVNMELSEGDVINSDKTKIPIDFKIYGKNFKNKTFKQASDYLSKQETKVQDDFVNKIKEGKIDKVSEGTLQIMLAKLGKNRDELNELQEQVLESKKQEDYNKSLKLGLAEYGKVVSEINKAEHGFNTSLDRYLNYKITDRPVLKAEDGLKASIEKFSNFANKISSNKDISLQDIMTAYKQSGLGNIPITKKSNLVDYKPKDVKIPKQEIFSTITSTANKYGVDPALMFTMADIESTFNPNATSKTGAAGLFQFTKRTGKQYGLSEEKRYDLAANTDAGAKLLLDNQKILIKNGIEPTPVYIYLAHQLGAGGAIELYNNVTKGTPISASTMKNMGLNFGKKSAEQYLAETTKKVMSRYDGYVTKLQQKDADLSLNAHQLKQQYQLPYNPEQIKSDLYSFDIKGITEKLKNNSYEPSNNKKFKFGGKIYAPEGAEIKNKENWDKLNSLASQIGIDKFNSPSQYQDYMWEHYPDVVQDMFNKGIWKNTREGEKHNVTPDYDLSEALLAFKDGLFEYRGTLPQNREFSRDELEKFTSSNIPISNGKYYWTGSELIVPQVKKENEEYLPSKTPSSINTNNIIEPDTDELRREVSQQSEEKIQQSEKKSKFLDKLNYGLKESLPYLRNLLLLKEKQFNPVLQQKSYQNPYDNFNTDFSIQSALNDSDRSTLTAMADERGNPSVRSARLAQIAANAIATKAPLYTQKYNTEMQLQNQKQVGQSQYYNQWEDINRGLKKDFEHEVLQTREVARQQKNMAIDNMMNDYLRKQEQNQAIDLFLLETNYDFNPITGKYEFNKEKAERNFKEKQFLAKNQPTQSTKKEKDEKTYVFRDGQFIPVGE